MKSDRIWAAVTGAGLIYLGLKGDKNEIESKAKIVTWRETEFTIDDIYHMANVQLSVSPVPFARSAAYLELVGGDVISFDTSLFGGYNFLFQTATIEPDSDFTKIPVANISEAYQESLRLNWERFGITVGLALLGPVMLGLGTLLSAAFSAAAAAATGTTAAILSSAAASTAAGPVGWTIAAVLAVVAICYAIYEFFNQKKKAEKAKEIATHNYNLCNQIFYSHCYQMSVIKTCCEKHLTIYSHEFERAVIEVIDRYLDTTIVNPKDDKIKQRSKGRLLAIVQGIMANATDGKSIPDVLGPQNFMDFFRTYNSFLKDMLTLKKNYEQVDSAIIEEATRELKNHLQQLDLYKTVVQGSKYLEAAIPYSQKPTIEEFAKIFAERSALIGVEASVGGSLVVKDAKTYSLVLSANKSLHTITPVSAAPTYLRFRRQIPYIFESQPIRKYVGLHEVEKYETVTNRVSSDATDPIFGHEVTKYEKTLDYRTLQRAKATKELAEKGLYGTSIFQTLPVVLEPSLGGNEITVNEPFRTTNRLTVQIDGPSAIYAGSGGRDPVRVPLVVEADQPITFSSAVGERLSLEDLTVDIQLRETLEQLVECPFKLLYLLCIAERDDAESLVKEIQDKFGGVPYTELPGLSFVMRDIAWSRGYVGWSEHNQPISPYYTRRMDYPFCPKTCNEVSWSYLNEEQLEKAGFLEAKFDLQAANEKLRSASIFETRLVRVGYTTSLERWVFRSNYPPTRKGFLDLTPEEGRKADGSPIYVSLSPEWVAGVIDMKRAQRTTYFWGRTYLGFFDTDPRIPWGWGFGCLPTPEIKAKFAKESSFFLYGSQGARSVTSEQRGQLTTEAFFAGLLRIPWSRRKDYKGRIS